MAAVDLNEVKDLIDCVRVAVQIDATVVTFVDKQREGVTNYHWRYRNPGGDDTESCQDHVSRCQRNNREGARPPVVDRHHRIAGIPIAVQICRALFVLADGHGRDLVIDDGSVVRENTVATAEAGTNQNKPTLPPFPGWSSCLP